MGAAKKQIVEIKAIPRPKVTALDFLESLYYDLNPILYVALAVWAYHEVTDHDLAFKAEFMTIVLYTVLIVIMRLHYRGHIR